MRTSNDGISLIKRHEGCRLEAYKCPAGVWTIGYGHTRGVKQGQKITMEQAEVLLRGDLATSEAVVNKIYKLKQHQFDALVSFVFNLGAGSFEKSTLRKLVVANPDNSEIRREFGKWVYAGGRKLSGLMARRADEANLYFKP